MATLQEFKKSWEAHKKTPAGKAAMAKKEKAQKTMKYEKPKFELNEHHKLAMEKAKKKKK